LNGLLLPVATAADSKQLARDRNADMCTAAWGELPESTARRYYDHPNRHFNQNAFADLIREQFDNFAERKLLYPRDAQPMTHAHLFSLSFGDSFVLNPDNELYASPLLRAAYLLQWQALGVEGSAAQSSVYGRGRTRPNSGASRSNRHARCEPRKSPSRQSFLEPSTTGLGYDSPWAGFFLEEAVRHQ
jgi:hypothetical protein